MEVVLWTRLAVTDVISVVAAGVVAVLTTSASAKVDNGCEVDSCEYTAVSTGLISRTIEAFAKSQRLFLFDKSWSLAIMSKAKITKTPANRTLAKNFLKTKFFSPIKQYIIYNLKIAL